MIQRLEPLHFIHWLLPAILIVAFGGAAVATLAGMDHQRPAMARAAELSYLPKGEYLKRAVLGYQQMAADLIWLKAVQHFGESKQTLDGYLWAYHAVDVVTDLDPKFVAAYQVAGTILGVWAGRPHESIALLTKGMSHNPEVWQLPFYVGYNYFFELHDPVSASKFFRIASVLPGAPAYLPKLAARMTVEAGDPDTALEFLERLYSQAKDELLREGLEQRIKQVIAERDIRFLQEAVRRYKTQFGKLPLSLKDLVAKDIISVVPQDPLGGDYAFNNLDGSIISTGLRQRLRVYRN